MHGAQSRVTRPNLNHLPSEPSIHRAMFAPYGSRACGTRVSEIYSTDAAAQDQAQARLPRQPTAKQLLFVQEETPMPVVRTQLDPNSSLDASISPTSGSLETLATDGQSGGDPSPRNHESGRELPAVRTKHSSMEVRVGAVAEQVAALQRPHRMCRSGQTRSCCCNVLKRDSFISGTPIGAMQLPAICCMRREWRGASTWAPVDRLSTVQEDFALAIPMQRPPEPVRSAQPVPEQFPGLKLGHLLGKGSYGRVYRGTWRGNTIAAKVSAFKPSQLLPYCRVC